MLFPKAALPLSMLVGALAALEASSAPSPSTPFNPVIFDINNSTLSYPDFTAAPASNISLYPNGSLFYHWRPRAHFIHPSNQLGDATAFWQAPDGTAHITALYSFLRGTGNSTLSTSGFSGSTTKDFVYYEDLTGWENPVQMGPGNEVDFIADFDGGVVPEGYKGLPTLVWTAVKGLPISWTIPYKDGYESQALAYSEDEGQTWIKLDGGANVPVIPRPPYEGNVVTGFRDPWIFQNALFDSLIGINSSDSSSSEPMHYISVSSGLHPAMPGLPGVEFDQAGPRVWLYRQASAGDWLNWTFCGPLLQSTINTTFTTPGSGWAATDYSDGNNYETSQVTSLDYSGDSGSEGTGMAFMSYGAESNDTLMLYRMGHWKATAGAYQNPVNASLAEGVVASDKGVEMNTALEGLLDWGLAYACTGLRSVDKRRIVYCWIKEAFADQDATKFATQYISSLTLPRQLYVKKIEGVVNNDLVLQNASWAIVNDTACSAEEGIQTIPVEKFNSSAATVDLVMLGIQPACELEAFRTQANDSFCLDPYTSSVTMSPMNFTSNPSSCEDDMMVQVRKGVRSGNSDALVDEIYIPLPRHPGSKHFELETTINFPLSSLRNESYNFAAGVSILRSPNTTNSTDGEDVAIVYQPYNESVIVQRRTALGLDSVTTNPEVGKLRLWQLYPEESDCVEPLKMRVFVDGSAVEVFINDVFVLTTRGYYWYEDSTEIGFVYQIPHNSSVSGEGDMEGMEVKFSNTSWWEGLVNAYPNRPTDKEQLIKQAIGYPEPENNPNAQGIIYNGTGTVPPFPNLG